VVRLVVTGDSCTRRPRRLLRCLLGWGTSNKPASIPSTRHNRNSKIRYSSNSLFVWKNQTFWCYFL